MKKILTILTVIILSVTLFVGCTQKASIDNTQATSEQNNAIDTQATQGISDASTTSNTLDTTQVDTQLGSANKSLASW